MNVFFNISQVTLPPFLCGIIVIILGYIKLWKLRKTKYPETVQIFVIWLIGIIALLLGIFGQILSMIYTFDSISQAGDISPSIVAEGIKSSYNSILIGLATLITSLIIWGILKGTKEKRLLLIKNSDIQG